MAMDLIQSEECCEIYLDGAFNIASAAELKGYLIQALATDLPLSVFLAQATELDVCDLQLLYAASRAWQQAGHSLKLVGPLQPAVSRTLQDAGFPPLEVTHDARLASEV